MDGSGEIDEGSEISGAFAVSCGDATIVFEPAEITFDAMAFGVKGIIAVSWRLAV